MSDQTKKLYVSTRALNRSTGQWESIRGEVVMATDYARLEQECRDAKCQAELMQRAAEVFREDKASALNQVDELRDLLRRIAPHFSAPRGLGGLHAEIDAAMSAKP